MNTETTDLLIIGAGPTGMALSIALHQRGVNHVLIDRLDQGQNTSRAGVIHAQTLESLTRLGVADRLVDRGLKLTRFAIRDRDRALVTLGFETLPSNFPFLLMLPQNLTEAVLAERIGELGGSVRRGVSAEHIGFDERGVRVTIRQGNDTSVIAAKWVVGGDGMHSLVRGATGTEFDGSTYAESFVLADVRLDRAPVADEVSLFFAPAGLVVVAPLPGGSYRIVATLKDAPETPSAADVQALLDTRGPTSHGVRVLEVLWSSRFRLHHRLARSYRSGRLFLMGDAAHVHSPAGGQGMNTGLVDAVVLGQLFADVIQRKRSEEALHLYQSLRRPAAAQVLALADRLTRLATVQTVAGRWLRNALLWVIDKFPPLKRRLASSLSGLSRAPLAQLPATATPHERLSMSSPRPA